MSAVDLAEKPARTGPCLLPWCVSDHHPDRSYLDHESVSLREGRMYARITWAQPLSAAARLFDAGVRVHLAVGAARLHLPVRGLADMVRLLRELGADTEAAFVERVVELAADGATS